MNFFGIIRIIFISYIFDMVIKTRFFVEDSFSQISRWFENYFSGNKIKEKIFKMDHSRFVNSNMDIITTIMVIYKKYKNNK